MLSKELTVWRKAIKASGASVTVVRIGSGKHQALGLYGPDATRVAAALEGKGMVRGPLSGRGTKLSMITMDTKA